MNIADVARLAGVSQTTVSRVLNNVPTVKEFNKKKVEEAIKKMGYRPNVNARRLAGARKNTIGIIIPPYRDMFGSFFVSTVLSGIGDAIAETDFDLLLRITRKREKEEVLKGDILNPGFIAGIIFIDLNGNKPLLDEVMKENIPFVVMNNYFEKEPINCVAVDNKKASMGIIDYLAKLGHRKIATITGRLEIQSGNQRLEGYKAGLRKNTIEVNKDYIVEGDFTRASASSGMKKLLKLKDIPTAVFVASDEMAQEAVRAIHEQGLKVPEDISIVGFDDNFIAVEGFVPLTTVHQPIFEMGQIATKLLFDLIKKEKKPPVKVVLETKLVERKSCKKI